MKEKRAYITAIVATLFCPCCALPAFLSLLGSTGLVSGFGWFHQLRPLFFIIAISSLGYLWYSYFKHSRSTETGCNHDCNHDHSLYHNKYFLIGMTVFIVSANVISLVL